MRYGPGVPSGDNPSARRKSPYKDGKVAGTVDRFRWEAAGEKLQNLMQQWRYFPVDPDEGRVRSSLRDPELWRGSGTESTKHIIDMLLIVARTPLPLRHRETHVRSEVSAHHHLTGAFQLLKWIGNGGVVGCNIPLAADSWNAVIRR